MRDEGKRQFQFSVAALSSRASSRINLSNCTDLSQHHSDSVRRRESDCSRKRWSNQKTTSTSTENRSRPRQVYRIILPCSLRPLRYSPRQKEPLEICIFFSRLRISTRSKTNACLLDSS